MALDAEEAPEGGGSRYPGGVPAQYSPADSTALARWPGRAAHARLDPGLPVPSCMDEDAGLRLVFWRRQGEVRRPHPCMTEPADRGPGEHVLLDRAIAPEPCCRPASTGQERPQDIASPRLRALLPHPTP